MNPEEKIKKLGINLPEMPAPLGSYVPAVKTGNLIFLSGVLPLRHGKLTRQGKVGQQVQVDDAKEDAKTAVINALSILKASIGSLDRIRKCIKMTGYIASAPDFTEHPAVLNAASDLLFDIFGESGRHSRAAVGVNVLPLNSPVEIELIFELS